MKIIASDIYPELVDFIKEGVVQASIFQDPFSKGRIAFKNLFELLAEYKEFNSTILMDP